MKSSTTIIFVLLFAFAAIVNAQTNTTSTNTDDNPVAKCIKDKNCGDDINCRADCAGVPHPSPKQANDTIACVAKCNQTDTTYSACVNSCVNTIYMPTGSTSSPSASGGSSPSGSSSPSGDATKSSSGSGSSSTGGSSGNSTKSAAQSLDARIAFSNSLSMMATLLLVCVVARMTNVGF